MLRPGEALITTLTTEQATYVWAVSQRGPVAFAKAPIGEKALAETVGRLRRALDPRVRRLADIPTFDVASAHELYRILLEPVKSGWVDADSLLVVGHGPLTQLPFSVLVTESRPLDPERDLLFANYRSVPWLALRHAVTTVPSVSALVTLRRLPAAPKERRAFVGFGDPYFSVEQAESAERPTVASLSTADSTETRAGALVLRDVSVSPTAEVQTSRLAMLPRLPDTADELRGIARATGADLARDVFLGVAANERTVKTLDLSGYRVVAFATHGLVPGDLDGLTQPALALTAPEVAKIDGDGLLTMEEILGLRLDADWVVLSACNTANGAGAGAEAISGLGRAFFYAGARALLVTHWPVETTSARTLTTELFKRQAANPGVTRAKALQQTMRAMIETGALVDAATRRAVFSYAQPIFWAPFALVGDGGSP
jgi:CHAT domain-containing protein